ncbi:hypothetical protein HZC27_03020 [Candidatus Roizmanbacteria bacterium]|nr:hypothetical protein [Candidatus Roizmanbacteria bacterium]
MKTEYRALIIIVLVVLLIILGAGALKKNNVSLNGPASTILFLTQPVKTFSGIIEKVDGDTLTVSQNMTMNSVTQKITYNVITDKNTVIEQPESPIPYLFAKTMNATNKQKTIKDLKVGQAAVLNTDEDLRTLSSQEFKATRITLNAIMNTLSGPVFDVGGNTLIIKTIPPFTPVSETPKERNYRVKITNDTEISRIAADGSPVRLTLNDIKRGVWVVAYTDGDVNTGTDFTALRIDPSISVEAPTPTPTNPPATPTPTPRPISPTSAPMPTVSSASPSSNTR